MLQRGRRFALLALAVLLVFFVVPPLWWAARDLSLLARATRERGHEEARWIIMRQIGSGGERQISASYWTRRPLAPRSGSAPVRSLNLPPPDFARDIPTCPDRLFSIDVTGPAGAELAPTPAAWRLPNRYLAVESARFRLADARLSDLRLVVLNACVNATAFATACRKSYQAAQIVSREEIVEQLSRDGHVRLDNGRPCWTLPEFVPERDGPSTGSGGT